MSRLASLLALTLLWSPLLAHAERSAAATGRAGLAPVNLSKDRTARKLFALAGTSSEWVPLTLGYILSDVKTGGCPAFGPEAPVACKGESGIEYEGSASLSSGTFTFRDLSLRHRGKKITLDGDVFVSRTQFLGTKNLSITYDGRTIVSSLLVDKDGWTPKTGYFELDGQKAFVKRDSRGAEFTAAPSMRLVARSGCFNLFVGAWEKTVCENEFRRLLPWPKESPRLLTDKSIQRPERGVWSRHDWKDEMDGTAHHSAAVQAEQTIEDWLGKPQTPLLAVRCQEGKRVEVLVGVGSRLDTDMKRMGKKGYATATKVRLRWDDGKVESTWLPMAENGKGFFFRKPKKLVRGLKKHRNLKLEIRPYQKGKQIIDFPTKGAAQALGAIENHCK